MNSIILFFIILLVYNVQSQNNNLLGQSSQMFAADIFPKLGEGNQLISPLVIQSGLSVLPTTPNARNQLLQSLRTVDLNSWANLYKNYLREIDHLENIEIKIGTGLYVTKKVQFLKSYKDLLSKFGTELGKVDFTQPEKVANRINKWVELKTNDKITNIVDPSTLTSSTEGLLVTALYFNGDWLQTFDEGSTRRRKFFFDRQEKEIDMMIQTEHFGYSENEELDAKFLEIPYSNEDFTMTIILPNKNDGLPSIEKQIGKIFEPRDMLSERVTVILPKFKFENKVQLTEILKKLGITHIFEDGLSFGRKKLKVDRVIQKSFVEVNEKGTEAAVVMEVEMSNRFGITEDPIPFIADHPFLFYIQQKSTGIVLFLGRYNNPEQNK